MRIIFFTIGDFNTASSRFRGYFVANELEKQGYIVKVNPSIVPTYPLIKPWYSKLILNLANFLKKFTELLQTRKDDIIYVQKSIFAYSPAIHEWFAKKILKRKLIFDFDDAIFLLKPKRTCAIVKMADAVIVGSHHLKEYAVKYNKNVFQIPTCIDTSVHKPAPRKENPNIVIGWIGSFSTLPYLSLLVKPFKALGQKCDAEFRIIGANEYEEGVPNFKNVSVKLIDWNLSTEWQELAKFDIGVMPLFDTDWERGKCAFKALQYMTMGIPAICSDVGEARYIIEDGINGFLCKTETEWLNKLSLLVGNKKLRTELGNNGRKTAEEKYDLETNTQKLITIIRGLNG
jgi:glycosyltransferase involved in cell wall biosynthesis